jgi:uncharacterized protein YjbI with pentapeptide repeats
MKLQAANVSLDECVLERLLLAQAKLEKMRVSDCDFRACDLTAANCSEGSLIRVRFAGGRMTGTDLNRAVIKDVVLTDCKLDMANFRFAKFTRVRFENCILTDTDFQNAELTDVEFASCLLEKTDFNNCKISRVDARGSQLFDIRGWPSLRGLKIDTTQLMTIAPELALALGLQITDE